VAVELGGPVSRQLLEVALVVAPEEVRLGDQRLAGRE
jgi:hypothetical protein